MQILYVHMYADAILSFIIRMGLGEEGQCACKLYAAIRSSRITGKIVKLLGLWPLTERHIHFCVNL